jgi:hypothetical protein
MHFLPPEMHVRWQETYFWWREMHFSPYVQSLWGKFWEICNRPGRTDFLVARNNFLATRNAFLATRNPFLAERKLFLVPRNTFLAAHVALMP